MNHGPVDVDSAIRNIMRANLRDAAVTRSSALAAVIQAKSILAARRELPPTSIAVTRAQYESLQLEVRPPTDHWAPDAAAIAGIPLLLRELGEALPEGCMDLRHGRID